MFAFPATEPSGEDVYDVAEAPPDPTPSTVAPKADTVLNYAVPKPSGPTVKQLIEDTPVRSIILPAILGGLALAFRVVLALFATGTSTFSSLIVMAIALLISVVTMLAGVGLVARMMGSDLGSPPVALVKLLATAIIGSLVFAGVTMIDRGDGMRGMIVALHASFLVYWVMISMWFELDIQESLFAVAIVGIMQAMLACSLWPR